MTARLDGCHCLSVFRSGAPEEVELYQPMNQKYERETDVPAARDTHAGSSERLARRARYPLPAIEVVEDEATAMRAAEQRFAAKKPANKRLITK